MNMRAPFQSGYTTTKLFEVMPGGQSRLMNTITFSSMFTSIASKDMNDPKEQLRVARELRNGWVQNGNKPEARYVIEQNGEIVN